MPSEAPHWPPSSASMETPLAPPAFQAEESFVLANLYLPPFDAALPAEPGYPSSSANGLPVANDFNPPLLQDPVGLMMANPLSNAPFDTPPPGFSYPDLQQQLFTGYNQLEPQFGFGNAPDAGQGATFAPFPRQWDSSTAQMDMRVQYPAFSQSGIGSSEPSLLPDARHRFATSWIANSFHPNISSYAQQDAVSRYSCTIFGCTRTFTRLSDLNRHHRTVHKQAEVHWCPIDGCKRSNTYGGFTKPFPRRDKRNEHVRKVHGGLNPWAKVD